MSGIRIASRTAAATAGLLILLSSTHAETIHVVQPGETLSSIAAHYLGSASAYRRLADANGIAAPFTVRAGQKLKIPDGKPDSHALISHLPPGPMPPRPDSPSSGAPAPPEIEIEEQELALIDVLGSIERTRGGSEEKIERGAKIRPGESIRTAPGSYALLSGMNGERFAIGPSTIAAIQELSATYSDRRIVVRIDEGQVGFSVPEIPFLSRYLIETPTGSVSTRHGSLQLTVRPPEFTAVSVFDGEAQAQVPMGSVDLVAGTGAVLRTTEPPPKPQPLPPRPGISVETSATMLILAAAGRPGQTIAFDVFADGNLQKLFASKTIATDPSGVALTRVELPPSLFWIRARAMDATGLFGEAAFAGPVLPSPR